MNANQRERLLQASKHLERAQTIIEAVKDENQDSFDNMPEGLQSGEKGEAMSTAIDLLDDVSSCIDEAREYLDNIE